ncbi:ubiquinol-cytochrome c reductase complex assembly factor 6 isoform X1 [Alexandromys fortis]|uniref:ubiquinol-cytochrome c reductase complex assembly factor 6 isoform X1 n=1 Tax=Alexandromys fortis TaxID=100897 RepID=UPI0021529922|nr:protein BRAWNIN isoform X1 [Microtus fortis]
MPGGVPWSVYVKMLSSSLLAMCAGAQVVHWYYRPDLTIPEIPPKPGELRTELLGLKERHHEPQDWGHEGRPDAVTMRTDTGRTLCRQSETGALELPAKNTKYLKAAPEAWTRKGRSL